MSKEAPSLKVGLPQESEKTFASGNLVIGAYLAKHRGGSPDLFLRGFTTPENVDFIRAVMLDARDMPGRYLDIQHSGPRGYAHIGSLERELGPHPRIGVIVSLTEILAKFPGQVYAVGREFHNNDSWWRHLLNRYDHRFPDYSPYGQFVRGIPIVTINERPWEQEVRIYPNDPENAYITPQMWTGVVTNSPQSLLDYLEKHSLTLDVPVFSDEYLDTPVHLRDLG